MSKCLIRRRAFLQSLSASAGLMLLGRNSLATSQAPDFEKIFNEIRTNLLDMVNEERAVAKLPPVERDELAERVATSHAVDMATGEFASHWGRNGFKPYHRYSFAGGTHATQENVSAADNTWSTKVADLKQDTSYLHVRLYQEQPPNDGHRRTILSPQHTHVGFGLAVEKLRLRMVELFVAKYVEVKPLERTAKPGANITFAGRMLKPEYLFNSIEVFYEPLPHPPELSWLREARGYSLPDESHVLRPKLPPPFVYADKGVGVVKVEMDGSFTAPVTLYHQEPGIYTIVTWLKRQKWDKAFPATEVCVRAA
jgi:uncharacterized protein YkwD